MPRGVLVEVMGGVFRMTKGKYRLFLFAAADGQYPDATDFGTYVGDIKLRATDLTPEQARDLLEEG